MPRIAGIKTERNTRGELTRIIIDPKKFPEAVPLLKSIGALEKTKFEIDCENGIPAAEARAMSLKFLKKLPWKK